MSHDSIVPLWITVEMGDQEPIQALSKIGLFRRKGFWETFASEASVQKALAACVGNSRAFEDFRAGSCKRRKDEGAVLLMRLISKMWTDRPKLPTQLLFSSSSASSAQSRLRMGSWYPPFANRAKDGPP